MIQDVPGQTLRVTLHHLLGCHGVSFELRVLMPLAMPKTSFSSSWRKSKVAQAGRVESGDERLRRLTLADALNNLTDIKRLLLEYERRL